MVPSTICPTKPQDELMNLGRGKYRLQPCRTTCNAEFVCFATSCLDSTEGGRVLERYEEMLQLLDR